MHVGILYNGKFVLTAESLGTNAVVIRFLCNSNTYLHLMYLFILNSKFFLTWVILLLFRLEDCLMPGLKQPDVGITHVRLHAFKRHSNISIQGIWQTVKRRLFCIYFNISLKKKWFSFCRKVLYEKLCDTAKKKKKKKMVVKTTIFQLEETMFFYLFVCLFVCLSIDGWFRCRIIARNKLSQTAQIFFKKKGVWIISIWARAIVNLTLLDPWHLNTTWQELFLF